MADEPVLAQSGARLRVGVFFILLWWLPVWLLAPLISEALGNANNSSAQHKVLVVLLVVQTIFGGIGLIVAGREVFSVLKSVPRRKVLPTIWRLLLSGKSDSQKSVN